MNRLLFRLARKELLQDRKFALSFLLNIALGLVGFLTLQGFKTSLETAIAQQSKPLLGADLMVAARRPFNDEEESILRSYLEKFPQARTVDLLSMAVAEKTSRLVQIRAIDPKFPFYGTLDLKTRGSWGAQRGEWLNGFHLWIHPELQVQLGIGPKGFLKLGQQMFRVDDIVEKDLPTAGSFFALAPRVYLPLKALNATQLIRKGSTATYARYFQIEDDAELESLSKTLDEKLTDPAVRVVTYHRASQDVGRMGKYLNDYLGLAALVAFFLSAFSAAYLLRSFLSARLPQCAVLRSLGLSSSQVRNLYLIQVGVLGLLAGVPALLFSAAWLPLSSHLLRSFFPIQVSPHLGIQSVVAAMALGTAGSLLVALPLLQALKPLSPALLFQESAAPNGHVRGKTLFWFLPLALLYWILATWQARSFSLGSSFVGILFGCAAGLAFLGRGELFLLENVAGWVPFSARLAFRRLARTRLSTLISFVTVALACLLINLIAQIESGLLGELRRPEGAELPGLFLLDIQEEQIPELKSVIEQNHVTLQQLSPLVRSRIESVNDKSFETLFEKDNVFSKEEEKERRFRNRGVNLSFRPTLSESEKIVKGPPLPRRGEAAGREEAYLSVDDGFAKRMHLKLGDHLVFDVQGIHVKGLIWNLRRVRWTSFQPNFLVEVEPGFIDDAPKIWLATLRGMSDEKKEAVQNLLVAKLPNVSILDVSRLLERIETLLEQMGWALRFVAFLSALAAVAVFFSLTLEQSERRRREMSLLKILGTPFGKLYQMIGWESVSLGFGASLCGIALSELVSAILAHYFFDQRWEPAWTAAGLTVLLVPLFTVSLALFLARQTLRQKPALR